MSLLSEAMENCIYITRSKISDGYGGYTDIYVEGVQFKAAIVFDTSIQARVAEKEGVTSRYTVTKKPIRCWMGFSVVTVGLEPTTPSM